MYHPYIHIPRVQGRIYRYDKEIIVNDLKGCRLDNQKDTHVTCMVNSSHGKVAVVLF